MAWLPLASSVNMEICHGWVAETRQKSALDTHFVHHVILCRRQKRITLLVLLAFVIQFTGPQVVNGLQNNYVHSCISVSCVFIKIDFPLCFRNK